DQNMAQRVMPRQRRKRPTKGLPLSSNSLAGRSLLSPDAFPRKRMQRVRDGADLFRQKPSERPGSLGRTHSMRRGKYPEPYPMSGRPDQIADQGCVSSSEQTPFTYK